jgi:hypothetical protein
MVSRRFALLLVLTAAACSTAGGPFGARGAADAPLPAVTGSDTDALGIYLDLMRRLVEGDMIAQADSFRAAEEAADFAPTTTNRLRYALALAVPGHSGSDAALAEQRLSALLSAGDALLPEERALAAIHLRGVEQRLILDAAAEQLRGEAAEAIEQRNTESARQLAAALEENRRLRAELEDATEKLDALTTIEQSIRERENGPE